MNAWVYLLIIGLVILLLGAVGIAALFGGGFLFRKDDKIERRREKAMRVKEVFERYGWTDAADMVGVYVIGDYSGIIDRIERAFDTFTNPEKATAFMTAASLRHLDAAMRDDGMRKVIIEKVDEFKRLQDLKDADLVKAVQARQAVVQAAKSATTAV